MAFCKLQRKLKAYKKNNVWGILDVADLEWCGATFVTKIHTFSISPFPGMCSDPYESIHIALSVRVGNQPVPPTLNMTSFQTLAPIPRDVNSRCHINKSTDGWIHSVPGAGSNVVFSLRWNWARPAGGELWLPSKPPVDAASRWHQC